MEAFYFNQLPFEEDIREFPFNGLEDVKVTPNQKQAAIELIRSMNLMTAGRDEDNEPIEALIPKYTYNPILQRFYQAVEKRALDPHADISEMDPSISSYIHPDASLLRQAAPKLANFKSSFTLAPVEKKEKKKRNWKDWYSSEVADSDLEELRKRIKVGTNGVEGDAAAGGGNGILDDSTPSHGDATSFSLDSALHSSQVNEVGPFHTVADFEAMIKRRDDTAIITRAFEQMANRIKESITQSYMGNYYEKVNMIEI